MLGKRQEAISRQLNLSNFLASVNQRNVVINTGCGTGLQGQSPSHGIPKAELALNQKDEYLRKHFSPNLSVYLNFTIF